MKFPYKTFPDSRGGSDSSAVINVQIALPAKHSPRTKRFEALVDSGASRCIFHADLGRAIGLDIETGEKEETLGISGKASAIYLHDISLYAPGGIIPVKAGFSAELPVAGLLGMKGFFEHFRITFDPISQTCELLRVFRA